MNSKLRNIVDVLSVHAWGVADLESISLSHPHIFDSLHRPFKRAIVLGKRLLDEVVDGIVDRPTPLYFHNYRQVNYHLDRAALEVAEFLQRQGSPAVAIAASQQIDHKPPTRGHISHVVLGWKAGIGWVGRNRLLVHPEFGQRLRYVSVLTDAALDCGTPLEADCGTCKSCIKACPAGAIKEKREDFDLTACFAKLEEFRRIPFIGQHICGLCIKACRGRPRQASAC